ncbi:MerR family DNA-binding protein [Thermoleptolyngbya sp. M55_K2018_002]|uniref:MerR family DNA-binding protein n=1 Tax=Thermoleptolyngbya sp. M55_K2018_002 TaxID=2747808 RepID=UPI001A01B583|nr:MerR family DNA-binding protein [Thermoleptolyngbya sp. M55_K2018_002]HIK42525.1 MerR family DNA-binding protein [Thermoleptolyngbya sp. M55_K2018_002]
MLIGELSKATGLSKDTIRFYEKMGLISGGDRQAGSRLYKEYSPEVVERLMMISRGKGLGFTLQEIRQLLDEWGGGNMPKQEQIATIERKLVEIGHKMQQLAEIKAYLLEKLNLLQQDRNADV